MLKTYIKYHLKYIKKKKTCLGTPIFPNRSQFTRACFPGGGQTCLIWPPQYLSLPSSHITDIAGTSEVWSKHEKDILDHLTSDVQEDYGQDYILQQRNYLKLIDTKANADMSPVLLDIRHAVSAKSPFAFYAPGAMAYSLLCLVSFSPTGVFDYLSKKLCNLGGSMPRALRRPN